MLPLRHLIAILILPFTVTVLVPAALLEESRPELSWLTLTAGALLLLAGGVLVFTTIAQFVKRGHGTLAPWDPPQHLVVSGVYQHVRNPMITGVGLILAGESVVLGSPAIAFWTAAFCALNAIWIPLVEEPGLERRFGEEWRAYRREVRRWIPGWRGRRGGG